jgi:hypothetical protein
MNAHLMVAIVESVSIIGLFFLLFAYYAVPGRAQAPNMAGGPPSGFALAVQARAQGRYSDAISMLSDLGREAV